MIGLDTNVILRFILDDDPVQTPLARTQFRSLSAEDPAWIGVASLLEIVWVLSAKNLSREVIFKVITDLLATEAIVVEQASAILSAAQRFRAGRADFADCLIASSARSAGCSRTVTLDRIAARDAGMELLG